MIKSILKLGLLGLLAVAVAGTPIALRAQDATTTNKPAAKPIARTRIPFNGKLKAVDNTAKTITIGKHTIQITSETRINKDGKPATLEDGVVGENVSGLLKRTADGKFEAIIVNFGEKAKPAAPASNTKTNTP